MLVEQLSIVDAIRRAFVEHADRAAVETAAETITYRELGDRVAAFAGQLEACTAPGEFVGVEAARGAATIVALAGALTSGRPFVVLDPRDSTSNAEKVAALGVAWLARGGELVEVPGEKRAVGQTGAAYAIHTSGSTGEPKCVLVAVDPLARMIADHVRRLELTPDCRTLQFARLTFDGCVTEILWTLTSGACLVVVDESRLAPGPVLQATLEDLRITHLKTTPFALTATEPTGSMSLRHVVNGGGACRPALVGKWSAVAAFHNAYGLTETTVCNLLSDVLDPALHTETVPLGEVVGDCGYEVVPRPGDPASRGELVIIGRSVAIGYLTADGVQRFEGAYRTGDVVEERDGRLYFVERADRQLKVRGYRLDPGEIESAACRLAGVVEAVVTAESHDGSEIADALVCYFVGTVDERAVRAHLEAVLDPYKVPSVVTRIEQMPYTPNGKVDRDALRAARTTTAAAVTDLPEDRVLALARQLTGVSDASLDDNFFDIGGDSASTVVLVNELRRLGWMDAGVRDVLRAENLKSLTTALRERSA
ncbi:non-ribosomal peptide synthetase [Lentzea sp. NPDC042327]|uniref:non-ribosomal peptide synthetase n=1 Tax=Lentzea sp. NPDC042327 TaxID=3154801 RepID=UPI003400E8FF